MCVAFPVSPECIIKNPPWEEFRPARRESERPYGFHVLGFSGPSIVPSLPDGAEFVSYMFHQILLSS